MAKNINALVLAVIFAVIIVGNINAAAVKTLKDGFVPAGIDGKLTAIDKDRWAFEPNSDVTDQTGTIKAGTSIEILRSAALEKMTADAQKRAAVSYRLWGRFTKYKDKNFIFPIYFLPITEVKPPDQSEPQKATPSINDPDDEVPIPLEIEAKLATKKIVHIEQLEEGMELKQDSILADRTGLVVKKGDDTIFAFDSFGRSAQKISIQLLPCQILELAQKEQAEAMDPVLFRISGIITKYKDRYYLLLQRAVRVYSHGNFGE